MKGNIFRRILILFVFLTVCVGCDQSTKYTAKHFLEGRQTLSYMGDILRLSYAENRGAFLGLGAHLPEKVRKTIFVVLVSLCLGAFLFFVILNKKLDALAAASGVLIIGGSMGNLIDRIINHGAVIDFMNIGIDSIRSGIFNVADVAIIAGVFMYAVSCSRKSHDRVNTAGS